MHPAKAAKFIDILIRKRGETENKIYSDKTFVYGFVDGKYNGELLPVGSYYYIIMTEGDNSGEILKGTVSIIKK